MPPGTRSQYAEAFASIPEAVAAISRGEIIVVVDDEDRENEGDLIMAAEAATPEKIAFFVRHTSGVICVPLTGERLDELDIPLMVRDMSRTPRRSAPPSRTASTTATAPPPGSPLPIAPPRSSR